MARTLNLRGTRCEARDGAQLARQGTVGMCFSHRYDFGLELLRACAQELEKQDADRLSLRDSFASSSDNDEREPDAPSRQKNRARRLEAARERRASELKRRRRCCETSALRESFHALLPAEYLEANALLAAAALTLRRVAPGHVEFWLGDDARLRLERDPADADFPVALFLRGIGCDALLARFRRHELAASAAAEEEVRTEISSCLQQLRDHGLPAEDLPHESQLERFLDCLLRAMSE